MAWACLVVASAWAAGRQDASDKYPPRWLQQLPARTNDTYDFVHAEGMAASRPEAKAQALIHLTEQVAIDRCVQVADVVAIDVEAARGAGNELQGYNRRTHASTHLTQESEQVTLRYRQADEYWEAVRVGGRLQYRYHVLYQVARPHVLPSLDPVQFTTRYGARGLWRSAIVPGWGQMHKGAVGKGLLFLGGEVALAGGIIATESLRSHYFRMAAETRDIDHRRAYRSQGRNMATARNVCIAGAVAVYVWNVVDAIVAPGARWVVESDRPLALMPYATPEGAGIYLSFNF